jgi:hypothetical protein
MVTMTEVARMLEIAIEKYKQRRLELYRICGLITDKDILAKEGTIKDLFDKK